MRGDGELQFEFTSSPAPVQAEGSVGGRRFYFRARGNTWTFTVAENDGDDPVGLSSDDVARGAAWRRTGDVTGEFAASWMPIDQAVGLIIECANAYLGREETK